MRSSVRFHRSAPSARHAQYAASSRWPRGSSSPSPGSDCRWCVCRSCRPLLRLSRRWQRAPSMADRPPPSFTLRSLVTSTLDELPGLGPVQIGGRLGVAHHSPAIAGGFVSAAIHIHSRPVRGIRMRRRCKVTAVTGCHTAVALRQRQECEPHGTVTSRTLVRPGVREPIGCDMATGCRLP